MALSEFWKEAIQLVPTAVTAVMGNRRTKAEKQQQAELERQRYLQDQALDVNSPLMRQQRAIAEGRIQRAYGKSIQDLVNTQRKLNTMGRLPLLDPERADETLSRLTEQGRLQAEEQAIGDARNTILGMAGGAGNMAAAYGGMIQPQRALMDRRTGIVSDIASGVGQKIIGYMDRPNQPSIQQATPTPRVPTQGQTILDTVMARRMGGQNQANNRATQLTQLAVPRANRGFV